MRPRTSARWRALGGNARAGRPGSRRGGPLRARRRCAASASTCSRARSSAASIAAALVGPRRRPSARVARWKAASSIARRRYRAGRMDVSELDYDLPPELIAAASGGAAGRARGCSSTTAGTAPRVTVASPICRASCTASSSSSTTRGRSRPHPDRRSPRGEVLLLEAGGGRPLGGTRAADEAAPRAGTRYGPVELARAPRRRPLAPAPRPASPAGWTPLPPYITEPLADPERLPDGVRPRRGLGRGADRRPALHARSCSRRLDVERVTLHVGSTRSGR